MAKAGRTIKLPTFAIAELSKQQRSELESSFDAVVSSIDVAMRGGVCSVGLMFEIATAHWRRTISSHSVIDSLARMEGDLSRAAPLKPPTKYKRDDLCGFWHFHFCDARFLATNLRLEADSRPGSLAERLLPIFRECAGDCFEAAAGRILHQAVIGSYHHRAGRRALTGECIVFDGLARHNYYQTLRLHDEDDVDVRQRIDRYRECDAAMGRLG
ncbi:hypothetical protein [Falsiroseomonas sp.]|uniref:hypothetical protein n=1 Tax=Falsiroseomonas sp. TaxID=2870721 RepID=UPI00271E6D4A|nr:hypothetical protein [Falsiroseomonas sp.]MDO9499566.1 hypothetical protein [Falsiroseomonas sp.]